MSVKRKLAEGEQPPFEPIDRPPSGTVFYLYDYVIAMEDAKHPNNGSNKHHQAYAAYMHQHRIRRHMESAYEDGICATCGVELAHERVR